MVYFRLQETKSVTKLAKLKIKSGLNYKTDTYFHKLRLQSVSSTFIFKSIQSGAEVSCATVLTCRRKKF